MTVIPFLANTSENEINAWLAALTKRLPEYKIVPFDDLDPESCASAEVAIVANPDPNDVAQLPSLKWIHSLWAGVERLVRELPAKNVAIVRLVDPAMANVMAEAVLAWTLYLHRNMPLYRKQQEARIWQAHDLPLARDRTVGIAGIGALGSRAAEVLLTQEFKVCGWSRSPKTLSGVKTFSGSEGLREMASLCDILVCLLPLTSETRGLIDAEVMNAMPNGASIINFARGPILVTGDLLAALDNGPLNHAVLDVFDEEPLPAENPLWSHPKLTVLPHISGPTNIETASVIVAENISRYFKTGAIPQAVNKDRGY